MRNLLTLSVVALLCVTASAQVSIGLEPGISVSDSFIITEIGDHNMKLRVPGPGRLTVVGAPVAGSDQPMYDQALTLFDSKLSGDHEVSFVIKKWMINHVFWVKAYFVSETGRQEASLDYFISVVQDLDKLVAAATAPGNETGGEGGYTTPQAPAKPNETAPEPASPLSKKDKSSETAPEPQSPSASNETAPEPQSPSASNETAPEPQSPSASNETAPEPQSPSASNETAPEPEVEARANGGVQPWKVSEEELKKHLKAKAAAAK